MYRRVLTEPSSARTLLGVLLVSLAAFGFADPFPADKMRVHFIDVGQGSATLLEFKCGAVLIDSGGAKDKPNAVNNYLDKFFALRPDLNKTLAAVFLTHCHVDHALGLEGVAKRYHVLHMVDDGVAGPHDSGMSSLKKMIKVLDQVTPKVKLHGVLDTIVRQAKTGYTDGDIDPVSCPDCDPILKVLAGGLKTKPAGWSEGAFDNPNNKSLVIRASLGKASILITGDLESEGIKRLTQFYGNGNTLASEILVAGHHGAQNGISPDLVRLVAPQIGAISCGKWSDGYVPGKPKGTLFTTYAYGHPNKGAVETLMAGVALTRPPIDVKAGLAGSKFTDLHVDKAVYCTGWDGSFVIDAYSDGRLSVKMSSLVAGLKRRSRVAKR